MRYSILIPVYKRYEEPKLLLDSIFATADKSRIDRVFLIDDGSPDDEVKMVAGLFEHVLPIEYLRVKHEGPVKAINAALKKVTSEYAIVISSDAQVVSREMLIQSKAMRNPDIADDPLGYLVTILDRLDEVGLVAPVILVKEAFDRVLTLDFSFTVPLANQHPNGLLMFTEQILNWPGFKMKSVQSVRGTCVAFKTKLIDDGSGPQLDASIHPWFRWTDDLCMRIRAKGYWCLMTSRACVAHDIYSDQPDDSFSVITRREYEEVNSRFRAKWKDRSELLDPRSLIRPLRTQLSVTIDNLFDLVSRSIIGRR